MIKMANKKEGDGRAEPIKLTREEKLVIEKIKRGLKLVDALERNNGARV